MLILIDGYNVIAPIGRHAIARMPAHRRPSADHLRAQRERLIAQLAKGLGADLASQTTVVFDAADAPPGLPNQYQELGISIEFSVGYAEADDRLEELIAQHSSPKRLTVVSSDHRVQMAATRRGALAVDSETWLDRLADGRPMLAVPRPTESTDEWEEFTDKPNVSGEAGEVEHWLKKFEEEEETPPKPPQKSPKPWHPFPEGYGEDLL